MIVEGEVLSMIGFLKGKRVEIIRKKNKPKIEPQIGYSILVILLLCLLSNYS